MSLNNKPKESLAKRAEKEETMKSNKMFKGINLQLFAEASGGAEGAAEGNANGTQTADKTLAKSTKGDKNPLANVKYGTQEEGANANASVNESKEQTTPVADRNTTFESLIKGEYKDLYDERVQEIVQKRLKGTKEQLEKYNSIIPTLEKLASKYGVDVNDLAALNKAVDDDDSYFENEAIEKGITVEQLKYIKKMERENAEFKKAKEENEKRANADRIYAKWIEDGQKIKGIYPSFDFDNEMRNPKFIDLLRNNIDVRTAYEVVHKDEIIGGALQFTAQQVEQKIANKIMANGNRPIENGIAGNSTAIVKNDVTQLTKADRDEIRRRVRNGEKIRFG